MKQRFSKPLTNYFGNNFSNSAENKDGWIFPRHRRNK